MGSGLKNTEAMNEARCSECEGALYPELVTRFIQYDGKWFMIEHVPALVCGQCGAQYFTPDSHDAVVRLITSRQPPSRVETMLVYDVEQL